MPPRGRTSTTTTTTRGRTASPARAERDRPAPTPTEEERPGTRGEPGTRSATIRLPFLTARFEVPRPPSFGEGVHLGPVTLPSPGKTAYYLGLGVLAVAEVVEWPVAAAIAAGTYVAQHTRGEAGALPHAEWHPGHNGHQQSSGA